MSLLSELRRRGVLRIAALYLIAAWIILQAAEVLVGLETLPASIGRPVLLVLGLGFPIALLLAWWFDITADGVVRDATATGEPVQPARRFDLLIVSGVLAVGGYLVADRLLVGENSTDLPDNSIQVASQVPNKTADNAAQQSRRSPRRRSIAVLPFDNLSPTPQDSYFADGVTEQVMALLTRIPGLAVTSRTSVFSLRNTTLTPSQIGARLNAAYLLTGSVRYDSSNVRVRVELVESERGELLWSQSFDHEFEQIFVIQDQIAEAVSQELRLTFDEERSATPRTDIEAHRLYLRGMFAHGLGSTDGYQKATEFCKESLGIDPQYAPAWECLASAYTNQANRNVLPQKRGYLLAEDAARKAIALESRSAFAYRTLGFIANYYHGDLHVAAEMLEQAVQIAPGDGGALAGAGLLMASLGQTARAVTLTKLAAERDPLNAVTRSNLAATLFWNREWAAALEEYRTVEVIAPDSFALHYRIGECLLASGNPTEALAEMRSETHPLFKLTGLALAETVMGDDVAAQQALDILKSEHSDTAAYQVASIYAQQNNSDAAFEFLEREFALSGKGVFSEILGEPWFASLHSDDRWMEFLRKVGRAPQQLAEIQLILPASVYATIDTATQLNN